MRSRPDGKLIVQLSEDEEGFALEHVLMILELPEALSTFTHAERVEVVLSRRYRELRRAESRWLSRWGEVELLVNPDVTQANVVSQKDNDQAARRGANFGKHPSHVDRFGARIARNLAVDAGKRRAMECLVRAVYAMTGGVAAGRVC